MQDIQEQDNNFSFAQLKAENVELKAANKQLVERNEFLARLVLDLQETVKQLKDEINRLKGQKSRPKFPPATLDKGDKGSGNNKAKQQRSGAPITDIKKIKHQEIVI